MTFFNLFLHIFTKIYYFSNLWSTWAIFQQNIKKFPRRFKQTLVQSPYSQPPSKLQENQPTTILYVKVQTMTNFTPQFSFSPNQYSTRSTNPISLIRFKIFDPPQCPKTSIRPANHNLKSDSTIDLTITHQSTPMIGLRNF